MTTKDRALVRFGQVAAKIQQRFGEGASNSEQLRVFNKAFEAVTTAKKYGQDNVESLIYAIAGELEKDLGENRYAAIKKWRDDKPLLEGCLEVADLFVKEVWSEVLQNHVPPQSDKAVLASIYRVSLLETFRARGKQIGE